MPELPEVETIVVDLRPVLVGRRIVACDLRFPAVVRYPEPQLFVAGVRDRTIQDVSRRGKYILAALDSHDLLVVHLGMTGQLLHAHSETPVLTHTHAIFHLDDGLQLRYRDIRRFGRLLLGTEAELRGGRQLPKLGPEPLEPDFLPQDLYSRLRGRRAPLKALLLDQGFIAGVGNIYADESLFRARLRPDRPGTDVGPRAARRLHASLRESLLAGIANRGSSIDDYVDANGEQGRQQEELMVYGHAGEPCPNCGRPLRQMRLAGRTTVFCARCQH